jgi:hypothetical protein
MYRHILQWIWWDAVPCKFHPSKHSQRRVLCPGQTNWWVWEPWNLCLCWNVLWDMPRTCTIRGSYWIVTYSDHRIWVGNDRLCSSESLPSQDLLSTSPPKTSQRLLHGTLHLAQRLAQVMRNLLVSWKSSSVQLFATFWMRSMWSCAACNSKSNSQHNIS